MTPGRKKCNICIYTFINIIQTNELKKKNRDNLKTIDTK